MNDTHDNSQSVYRLFAIGLGVVIVVVTICGSLGLVWMRQQVTQMAAATSRLQSEIAEAERESAGLDARLGRALSPQYLATSLPEGLRPSNANQIVWSVRAEPLVPAAGFDQTALLASAHQRQPFARAGSALAATSAPLSPARSHLVTTSQSREAAAEEAPLTVTFDLALLGSQPAQGASARR